MSELISILNSPSKCFIITNTLVHWLILKRRMDKMSIEQINKHIYSPAVLFHKNQHLIQPLVYIEEKNGQNVNWIN